MTSSRLVGAISPSLCKILHDNNKEKIIQTRFGELLNISIKSDDENILSSLNIQSHKLKYRDIKEDRHSNSDRLSKFHKQANVFISIIEDSLSKKEEFQNVIIPALFALRYHIHNLTFCFLLIFLYL